MVRTALREENVVGDALWSDIRNRFQTMVERDNAFCRPGVVLSLKI